MRLRYKGQPVRSFAYRDSDNAWGPTPEDCTLYPIRFYPTTMEELRMALAMLETVMDAMGEHEARVTLVFQTEDGHLQAVDEGTKKLLVFPQQTRIDAENHSGAPNA